MNENLTRSEAARTILALCKARGRGKTICPSEAARALASNDDEDWHGHLVLVRSVATELARRRQLVVLQGGKPVEPGTARGPIRLGATDLLGSWRPAGSARSNT